MGHIRKKNVMGGQLFTEEKIKKLRRHTCTHTLTHTVTHTHTYIHTHARMLAYTHHAAFDGLQSEWFVAVCDGCCHPGERERVCLYLSLSLSLPIYLYVCVVRGNS